jgi:uncharacterized protein YndB with AHSA1/START domain
MLTATADETFQTINIQKEITIAASPENTFQAILEEVGPGGEMPDGTPFPMKIDARPGGIWIRDLGNNTGHFWGHVQVIKPPTLLELCGPMFMSYPATNFLQYRLTPEGKSTRLKITHRAMGLIPADHREGVAEGWAHGLNRIRQLAERRTPRPEGAPR